MKGRVIEEIFRHLVSIAAVITARRDVCDGPADLALTGDLE
jgi:hypothetical protein